MNELVNIVNESYKQNRLEINDVFYQHLKVDENDPFSYKPNDQWLIFSQFLSEQNVFEGKSNEEVLEIEELLKKITDGMDSLVGKRNTTKSAGIDYSRFTTTEMTSYEAQIDYGASIAALKLFNKKYVIDDVKEGFNTLINQYALHNKDFAMNHTSLKEDFSRAIVKMNETIPHFSRMYQNVSADFKLANKLTGPKSAAEIAKMMTEYMTQFEEVKNEEDVDRTIDKVNQLLLEYMLKNIQGKDKEKASNMIAEETEDTLGRISG